MAAVAVTAADARPVGDWWNQLTREPAVAIAAGQVVRLNASSKWVLAQGDVAGNAAGCYIAMRAGGVGVGLTAFRVGKFAGLDTTLAVATAIFLSGAVAGGLDTVAGAVSVQVGRIILPGVMEVACPL